MVPLTTMRSKDTPPSADRLAEQPVFDVSHLVPESLQLLCQRHLGLQEHLTLFVLSMLFRREAHSERPSHCPCEYTPCNVSAISQKWLKSVVVSACNACVMDLWYRVLA